MLRGERKEEKKEKDKRGELIEAHLEQVYSDSLLQFGLSAARH